MYNYIGAICAVLVFVCFDSFVVKGTFYIVDLTIVIARKPCISQLGGTVPTYKQMQAF